MLFRSDVYAYPAGFLDTLSNTVIYVTGAGLKYMTGLGSFSLIASDPGASSTDSGAATGNSNNGRTALSGRWFGKFMDGALQPTLSYMTEGRQNQSSSTKNLVNTYTSGGIRFTKPVFDIDADYLMNSFADKTTAGQSDVTNSMFILGRYKMVDLGLKAFATYENSTRKTETSATVEKKVDTSAITLGVEYYPKKDDDFRYHLAYTNQTIKTDLGTGAAATNQAMQQIIAGVRFKSDLLK